MKKNYEVWKLQAPLFSSDDSEVVEVMAYTEDKEKLAIIPMLAPQIANVFKGEAKVYVLARVRRGVLQVEHQVEEEDW